MPLHPDQLPSACFQGSKTGIEKEGLRVYRNGRLSRSSHPQTLGSSLTHPCITTDFSEALLELITPPCHHSGDALSYLTETQTFVHSQLPNEVIWAASMPCLLHSEDEIRIADYGSSEQGMEKVIYRRGLAHRYGKLMQVIAGIHFNHSFSEDLWPVLQQLAGDQRDPQEFIAERYMSTIRNIRQYDWLLLYLFGASPATCHSFSDAKDKLQRFDKSTYYQPYATSLRMGDLGYSNRLNNSGRTFIDYNSLTAYIDSLRQLINTPCPDYARYGVQQAQQLNSNVLQIENEYYTSVRPKQIQHSGETPLQALEQRGIRYIEIRSIDINPFTPTGVEQSQLHFLEVFLNYCLLSPGTQHSSDTDKVNGFNLNQTAYFGRDPLLKLIRDDKKVTLTGWAEMLFDDMLPVAGKLDGARSSTDYTDALTHYRLLLQDSELTPSARILTNMREHKESFTDFVLRMSLDHHEFYLDEKLEPRRQQYYEALTRHSTRQQQRIEGCDEACNRRRQGMPVPCMQGNAACRQRASSNA